MLVGRFWHAGRYCMRSGLGCYLTLLLALWLLGNWAFVELVHCKGFYLFVRTLGQLILLGQTQKWGEVGDDYLVDYEWPEINCLVVSLWTYNTTSPHQWGFNQLLQAQLLYRNSHAHTIPTARNHHHKHSTLCHYKSMTMSPCCWGN